MTITVQKQDAERLTDIEKKIREIEFNLVSLNQARNEILNRYFSEAELLPMEGEFQVASTPDWSEIIVVKK